MYVLLIHVCSVYIWCIFQLRKLVVADRLVLKEARRLRDAYGQYALEALQCFSKSDARSALQNIVQATTSV